MAMVEHLRKLSGDPELTISEIKDGSVILTVECSEEGSEWLEAMFKAGLLKQLEAFPVQNFHQDESNWQAHQSDKKPSFWKSPIREYIKRNLFYFKNLLIYLFNSKLIKISTVASAAIILVIFWGITLKWPPPLTEIGPDLGLMQFAIGPDLGLMADIPLTSIAEALFCLHPPTWSRITADSRRIGKVGRLIGKGIRNRRGARPAMTWGAMPCTGRAVTDQGI